MHYLSSENYSQKEKKSKKQNYSTLDFNFPRIVFVRQTKLNFHSQIIYRKNALFKIGVKKLKYFA